MKFKKLQPHTQTHKEFMVSVLIMLWVSIAFFLFQTITFESNDDNSMARMAYGMIGDYETHLVFINVFIGQCLKLFLTVFPNVPWYTVFQCSLVLISFFIIIYLFLCRFGVSKGLLPTFVFVAFFGTQFFLRLQFSKTAGISALSGILLLFDAVKSRGKRNIWKYILGAMLTIAGSMYRFNVFGMMLIPMFGIGLFLVWEPLKQKNWKELIRICLPFVIVFGLCFIFRVYDTWSYQQDPDWAAYKEFNSLRAQLMDYGFPDYETNQALYESLNISSSDLSMFQSWDFADPEVFTVEAMRKLVEAKEPPIVAERFCLDAVRSFFLDYSYSTAMIVAMIVCVATGKGKQSFILVYAVAAAIGVQVYLYYKGRYGINRIDVSLVCAVFAMLVLYGWGSLKIQKKWVTGLLACAICISPFIEYDLLDVTNEKTEDAPVRFYELIATDPEKLYVRTVSTSIPRIPRPLEIYPVGYQSNSCSLGGWGTYTVPYLEMWEKYGVTNPFRDLVDNPNLYLVATGSVKARIQYIRDHYEPDADAYLVKVSEDGYPIYRVSTTPGPVLDTSRVTLDFGVETINCAVAADRKETEINFHGYLYGNNMNSFTSNIYLSLTGVDGEEYLYYTTQSYNDAFGDLMNGAYGTFSCELPMPEETDMIRLYLEVDDVLYGIYVGTVGEILSAAQAE